MKREVDERSYDLGALHERRRLVSLLLRLFNSSVASKQHVSAYAIQSALAAISRLPETRLCPPDSANTPSCSIEQIRKRTETRISLPLRDLPR